MTATKHSVEWTLKVGAEGSEQVKALRAELDKVGQIDSFVALKKQTEETKKSLQSATSEVARLAKEIKASESSTGALAQSLAAAKKEASGLKGDFEQQSVLLARAKERTDAAKSAWKEARVDVANLAREIRNVASPTAEMVAAFNEAEKRAEGLGSEFERQKSTLKGVEAATKSAGQEWKDAAARAAGLERELAGAKKTQASLSASFDQSKKSAADFKSKLDQQTVALQKQRTGLNAVGISTTSLASAQLKAKGQVAALQTEVDKSARRQGILRQAMSASAAVTEKTTGTVRNLVAAYLGLNAVQMGGQYMLQNIRMSEQSVYNLEASLRAANREFGAGIGTMDGWTERLKGLGQELKIYSNSELRNAASRTVDMTKRLGMSVTQMDNIIRISANLGAGKTDLEGAIERVTAALRGEAESAEFLGLTLNENYVKAQYEAADATGRAWKNLSDLEKAQVRYNILVQQASGMHGRAAGSISTMNGALAYMKATIDNTLESNEDLSTSIKEMSREIADAAPDVVSFARSLTSVLASIVQIMAALPDGTGSVLATGLITKWLFGAATKVFPSLVAGLALVPAQVAAIAVSYGLLQNQISKWAQNQEGTPQWLVDADKNVRGYLDVLNSGNAADVQAGLAQAMERQRLEKIALEKQIADERAAKEAMTESERVYADQVRAIQSELSKFRDTEWDKIEKDIKAHIKDLISEEERYADRVKTLDEKRRMANLSTEEKIRSMLRGTMTEHQAYIDKQAEANESLSKARQALIAGDGGGAEFWAKKAQDQFADLNDEVRDGERVIISRAQAQATAIQGLREAGQALNDSLLEQRRAEDAGHNVRMQQIGEAKTALQNLKTVQENIGDIETLLTVKDSATPTLENVQKAAEKLTEIKMQIGAVDGVTSVVQSAQASLDSLPESTTVNVSAQDNATGPVRWIETETGKLLTNKTMQVNAQDNATGKVRLIETETGLLLTNKSMDVSAQDKATEQVRIIEAETGKLLTNKVMDVEVRGNATEEIDEVIDKVEEVPAAKSTTVTTNDRASAVLERIKNDLAQIRDKTVTVTVRYRRVGSSDGLASGGRVPGYAFGGRLPGYSLRDNLLGLIGGKQPIGLAGGEDVTSAPATRVIYNSLPWLMPDLNRVRTTADLSRIIAKLQALPMRGYADGGRVVDEFRATLISGNRQASVTTRSRSEFEGLKMLVKELDWEKKVRGA